MTAETPKCGANVWKIRGNTELHLAASLFHQLWREAEGDLESSAGSPTQPRAWAEPSVLCGSRCRPGLPLGASWGSGGRRPGFSGSHKVKSLILGATGAEPPLSQKADSTRASRRGHTELLHEIRRQKPWMLSVCGWVSSYTAPTHRCASRRLCTLDCEGHCGPSPQALVSRFSFQVRPFFFLKKLFILYWGIAD